MTNARPTVTETHVAPVVTKSGAMAYRLKLWSDRRPPIDVIVPAAVFSRMLGQYAASIATHYSTDGRMIA